MVIVAAACAGVAAGCGTAVTSGTAVALDSFDLQSMARQMADSLAADPDVQAAQAAGPVTVVVMPVENRMRGEVLPRGQAQAFTAQVRANLSREAPGAFRWINNRETFYALRGRELEAVDGGVDLGPAPDAIDPQYALYATFTSLADVGRRVRTASYVCTFELTDLTDRRVLWTDVYNVQRRAVRGVLD